jgi:3-dehydroquinate synthase
MSDTTTVHVELGARSYDIEIGSGNLDDAQRLLIGRDDATHAVIITDETVDALYGDRVAENFG